MNVREPLRAGSFYEASASACRRQAASLLESADPGGKLEGLPVGGLVPHAGWAFSGRLAAMTFKALAAAAPLETVVFLGADHTGSVRCGEVYDRGAWRTPLGTVQIDEEAAGALVASGQPFRANPDAHAYEHSIEVQVPLLQTVCAEARIVPVAVPPTPLAVEIGGALAEALRTLSRPFVVVGSTDLTHHGGHFGSPGGQGHEGVEYAVRNDRRMLDLIEAMKADDVIVEARERRSACGAGAIAAAIAACGAMGATRGICLEYTNSYEVMGKLSAGMRDYTTVGYASVVFV